MAWRALCLAVEVQHSLTCTSCLRTRVRRTLLSIWLPHLCQMRETWVQRRRKQCRAPDMKPTSPSSLIPSPRWWRAQCPSMLDRWATIIFLFLFTYILTGLSHACNIPSIKVNLMHSSLKLWVLLYVCVCSYQIAFFPGLGQTCNITSPCLSLKLWMSLHTTFLVSAFHWHIPLPENYVNVR